jgi:hypothetical protein
MDRSVGTWLAKVGAYVLAGELAATDGDHRIAFGRYEEVMHGYAEGCQKWVTRRQAHGARKPLRGRALRHAKEHTSQLWQDSGAARAESRFFPLPGWTPGRKLSDRYAILVG